ncbi:putative bifunctional diguanylate cyclase/phosphodiesterase [Noviherbaspirillum sp.]|uniref:putative bifunctional diguanylate cyclase/phosphodiesterase n=1 Tax=Noviherbaspirillum sp. TaxID=1926288 RepID=UPI002FE29BB5
MTGTYHTPLVALSLLVAMLAGYATLELSARTRSAMAPQRWFWLAGSALAAGTGIWSMHFIGMQAFTLETPVGFETGLTLLSWAAPVATSAAALFTAQRESLKPWHYAAASTLAGAAIAGMHYIGMAAMRMSPSIRYEWPLVILSVAIAIGLSGAAIWAMRHISQGSESLMPVKKILVAFLLGTAIAAMHYIGMAAAEFPAGAISLAADSLDSDWLPGIVFVTSVTLLVGATLIAYYDRRRLEHQQIAETDALTGLKNRHFLQKQLPALIARAQAGRTSLHLAFVDLDGFKLVNDTMGHDVGDAVLVIASRRIHECLREGDIVIRVGGDEFVIILVDADEARVEHIMQRVVSSLKAPMRVGSDSVNISASIGVARHLTGQDAEPLLLRADTAMYHAKRQGRNMWKRFSPHMDAERVATAETHKSLRRAFERSEFRLFYQPKYSAGSRQIVGVEALVRWIDPQRGMRLPAEFIAVAERTGMIAALGDWVLNEACRQMRSWTRQGWVVPVSINVSALQVRGHEMTGKVRAALAKHDVDAQSLTLEITESVAIEDPAKAMQVFQSLRHCGVSISIDDFGTGYSSLAYLRDFPAAEIKIDRAFVRDISTNRQALELVKAIVAMGHALGMLVVAEGVEDERTTRLLENLGCDVLQGYFLAQPMDADDLHGLLLAQSA